MPSGEALTALCRESDQFWREFCAAVDRPADADAAAQFMDDFNEWRKARRLNVPE
jgi:crotonobetainyl-CoA:carnitine CoA-transferase CaiB-like acyl-CoA transferase